MLRRQSMVIQRLPQCSHWQNLMCIGQIATWTLFEKLKNIVSANIRNAFLHPSPENWSRLHLNFAERFEGKRWLILIDGWKISPLEVQSKLSSSIIITIWKNSHYLKFIISFLVWRVFFIAVVEKIYSSVFKL